MYFHTLLNEDGDWNIMPGDLEHSKSRLDFGYYRRIKAEEAEWAMRRMNRGRATESDKIPVEFWKNAVGQVRSGSKAYFMLFLGHPKCLRMEYDDPAVYEQGRYPKLEQLHEYQAVKSHYESLGEGDRDEGKEECLYPRTSSD